MNIRNAEPSDYEYPTNDYIEMLMATAIETPIGWVDPTSGEYVRLKLAPSEEWLRGPVDA